MSYIDIQYINLISTRLNKFVKKKDNLYNFRCPYCGDSQKYKNRARGFLYMKNADMIFKCHNCGIGRTLANFLKDLDVTVHDQYIMERFKSGLTGRGSNTANPKFKFDPPVFVQTSLSKLQLISELNNLHPANQYLLNRQIPKKYFSKFYYAEDFHEWAETKTNIKESRIIIPLLSKSGKLFGHQARAIDKNSKLRYITTILDNKYVKLFGLDTVNFDSTIYVTEGPFDSLFIPNAIAMCGSDVHLDKSVYKDRVFILDNEPRNIQIVNKYDKLITAGEKVVIWPNAIKEKDINDMIISGLDPQKIIQENIYSGLEAKVQFITWKKV